jgi:2-C-methyl-D-erythritol 4-phosphate cytidylyltransferase
LKYKITAIITAAGSGKRFRKNRKNTLPKQFVKLNGKPVILYSLQVFQNNKNIEEIIISANEKYFDLIHDIAVKNSISKLTCIVGGGKTRFESVRNAVLQIENAKNKLVIVHDAARPNIDNILIDNLLAGIKNCDGIIPGFSITETIKRCKKNMVIETIDRENLFIIQTPQLFSYKSLISSYLKCGNRVNFTDESALIENAGYKVNITNGKIGNIKLTNQDDLTGLKMLLK